MPGQFETDLPDFLDEVDTLVFIKPFFEDVIPEGSDEELLDEDLDPKNFRPAGA